jgi:hypothetical protein
LNQAVAWTFDFLDEHAGGIEVAHLSHPGKTDAIGQSLQIQERQTVILGRGTEKDGAGVLAGNDGLGHGIKGEDATTQGNPRMMNGAGELFFGTVPKIEIGRTPKSGPGIKGPKVGEVGVPSGTCIDKGQFGEGSVADFASAGIVATLGGVQSLDEVFLGGQVESVFAIKAAEPGMDRRGPFALRILFKEVLQGGGDLESMSGEQCGAGGEITRRGNRWTHGTGDFGEHTRLERGILAFG